MGNKMLIDAAHPEETRVVVVRNNNRIEELDYEAATRKQLRGNIYLAKVTRVEPSLQAAFVDYGGNRHGFLAFNEIHPDYYQIPIADRQALLEQDAAEDRAEGEEEEASSKPRRRRRRAKAADAKVEEVSELPEEAADVAEASDADNVDENAADEDDASDDATVPGDAEAEAVEAEAGDIEDADAEEADDDADDGDDPEEGAADEQVESVGAGDAMEELPVRKTPRRRAYKIQEVIKRRQIILVQVVKEERGNKGAALTTYLSLAGRYCVLMPNTARGGGISRKITDIQDRKRLKDVAKSANVPDGMGLIVRTAGAHRTKAEVKRDFDYLLRLWENVRDLTLESSAPCLVYEEGSLIKRAIRDLYTKDIDSIVVEGEDGYKEAKDFMRMLMPSHARHIKAYKEKQPLFMRHSIENQLDVLLSPQVTLPSGGYIVINQTEALVAIDVNSGKATREHNIEDTALKTNLEAAEEVARQMRLRDLAGLIVIDFIDMEERRNNRSVERRLKDRLKSDRARIQVGRISHFGLLEMSRQRMRSGVLESSTRPCPSCDGRGFVRSVPSAALQVLRGLEDSLQRGSRDDLVLRAPPAIALYILNQKRDHLLQIEAQAGVSIFVEADDSLSNSEFAVDRATDRSVSTGNGAAVVRAESTFIDAEAETDEEGEGRSKKRRRRRGRRGSRQDRRDDDRAASADDETEAEDLETEEAAAGSDTDEDAREGGRERKSKRGSRGGRRRRSRSQNAQAEDGQDASAESAETKAETADEDSDEEAPAKRGRRRTKAQSEDNVSEEAEAVADADAEQTEKPKRRSRSRSRRKKENGADTSAAEAPQDSEAEAQSAGQGEQPVESAPDDHVAHAGNGADLDAAPEEPESDAAPEVAAQPDAVEAEPAETTDADETEAILPEPPVVEEEPASPPRRGWWQRR